jgi:hypothetical protein
MHEGAPFYMFRINDKLLLRNQSIRMSSLNGLGIKHTRLVGTAIDCWLTTTKACNPNKCTLKQNASVLKSFNNSKWRPLVRVLGFLSTNELLNTL